jgi:hypothetical protein
MTGRGRAPVYAASLVSVTTPNPVVDQLTDVSRKVS